MRCVWMVMIVQNLMVCDGWEVEDEWRHQLLIIGDVVQRKRRWIQTRGEYHLGRRDLRVVNIFVMEFSRSGFSLDEFGSFGWFGVWCFPFLRAAMGSPPFFLCTGVYLRSWVSFFPWPLSNVLFLSTWTWLLLNSTQTVGQWWGPSKFYALFQHSA